eukprot:198346-Amphidinium_carterae.2
MSIGSVPNDTQMQHEQQLPPQSSASTTIMPQQQTMNRLDELHTLRNQIIPNCDQQHQCNPHDRQKPRKSRSTTPMGNTDRHSSNDKRSITKPLHSHTTENTQTTRPTYTHSSKRRTDQHLRNPASDVSLPKPCNTNNIHNLRRQLRNTWTRRNHQEWSTLTPQLRVNGYHIEDIFHEITQKFNFITLANTT